MTSAQQLTTLIIPGFQGSEDAHWQTWFQSKIKNSQRVHQNWEEPILAYWAENVRNAIDRCSGKVWIVAHSFGCLAAILAGIDRYKNIEKYSNVKIFDAGEVEGVSATNLRMALAQKNEEEIAKYLPEKVSVDQFLQALGKQPKEEKPEETKCT